MDAVRRSLLTMRGRLALLAVIVVIDIGLVRAHQAQPRVNVVTVTPQAVGPQRGSSRGGGVAAPITNGSGATGPVTDGSCPSAGPDPTWTCKDGTWLPPSGVGMGAPHLGACAGASPAPSFVCEGGMWTLPASGSAGVGASTTGATSSASNATTTVGVTSTGSMGTAPTPTGTAARPGADAAPGAAALPGSTSLPGATVPAGTPGAPPTAPQLPGGGPACAGQPPSVAWTCRNGVWVPGSGGGE